ncbi:hypothetical protein RIF29_19492 [Crotalaria pallida]|uniref:Uncharacterized protein n=1 Tax=Crotalaria pallida TaxID=3830 RepID=A0AAN9F3W2_CROPI
MRRYTSLIKPGPVSDTGMAQSDFEFPLPIISTATPNDVVFCGKLITRQTEPAPRPQKPKSAAPSTGIFSGLRSRSGMENRYRKIGSSSGHKHYNGLLGAAVKFPLQMELSDMKMRQERREPFLRPKMPVTVEECGGESCWELVRPLRRRGTLLRAFCVPIV